MDVNNALNLVRYYVHEKTGESININTVAIMRDRRQLELLEDAIKIINHYYNEGKVKIINEFK